MRFLNVKESELKSITLFLLDKNVIFHPKISPNGIPDFTEYKNKKFIVILDRNLLTRILKLVNEGELKDQFSLKIVSSLLAWAEFNDISLTSGLALAEYSHHHKRSDEASLENNTFLEIFKKYNIRHWLDLATGKQTTIPPIELDKGKNEEFKFFIKDDHFKMHYLEMLKISQLYFDRSLSVVDKFNYLFKWIYENILICKYTTFYAALALGGKSKMFINQNPKFEEVDKNCRNQAWDLTYLSFWSTQYYFEEGSEEIYLFATLDKELKDLFKLTHKESLEVFKDIFKKKTGEEIIKILNDIYKRRTKPEIDSSKLEGLIMEEKENLKRILKNKMPPNNLHRP